MIKHFIAIEGFQVRVVEIGVARRDSRKPVLVLLHSFGDSWIVWKSVISRLAETFRIVAFDFPGHGETQGRVGKEHVSVAFASSFVNELIGYMGLGKPNLCGFSLGGRIALQYGLDYPNGVRNVIAISTPGLGRNISWLLRVLTLPGIGEYGMQPMRTTESLKILAADPKVIPLEVFP